MYIVTKVNCGYNVSMIGLFIASDNSISFNTKQEALEYVRCQLDERTK